MLPVPWPIGHAALRVRAAASSSYTPPAPPFNVVITGGSKGVGRALATEFLRVRLEGVEGRPVAQRARGTGMHAAWIAPEICMMGL